MNMLASRKSVSIKSMGKSMNLFIGILIGVNVFSARTHAEDGFPYTLVVSNETADVLSGPGKAHYATDRLPQGSKIEIHRHDPGGYYAIRPPEGSFSLVLVSAVEPTADPAIVEVKSNLAKAWVGSRLQGDFKPLWQLKLKAGELLSVIKKVEISAAHSNQSQTWYQVEPPSGEFRWIHKDSLGSPIPASVSSAEITNRQIQQSRIEVELLKQINEGKANAGISSTKRSGWRVMDDKKGNTGNVSANEASFDLIQLSNFSNFQNRAEAIDLALTQMVLGPKVGWNLDALQQSVAGLRNDATTGVELARANELAKKIIGFQKVKATSVGSEERYANRGASLLAPKFSDNNERILNRPRVNYDGRGVLRKLYANGGIGRSIYALEDENGKVVKTISASSGVNLERFVGKPVGLFGKAGFNQRLNRPHLTAQRVIDLDKIR